MTEANRGKGRPKGSEKDDSRALSAIADMILTMPTLKATTAMRRHKRDASDADIRRWQGKWKERRPALLAAAQTRAETRRARAVSVSSPHTTRNLGAIAEAARLTQELYNSPSMRLMRELQDSPTMRAIRGLDDSAVMRAMRAFENDPVMRLARGLESSPTMRAARQIADAQDKLTRLARGW